MKLLLTGAFNIGIEQMNRLQSIGYNITFIQDERLPIEFDVSAIDAVVCNGLFITNDIKKFKKLKFIQLTSAGMDRVPIEYIKANNIQVLNARGVYSNPIAEWVVLKILEIYKNSRTFYDNQKQHKWVKQRNLLELEGKTASIIGFGSVGIEIAKRLKPFGLNLVCVDNRYLEQNEACLVNGIFSSTEIDAVLKISDIIILTLPLTERTKHFINDEKLSIMKDDSVLINVSRGGIIEESSLIKSLNNGKLFGVALDVFEEEPLPENNPLWSYERVLISPHNSFISDKINNRLFELIFTNLYQFIS